MKDKQPEQAIKRDNQLLKNDYNYIMLLDNRGSDPGVIRQEIDKRFYARRTVNIQSVFSNEWALSLITYNHSTTLMEHFINSMIQQEAPIDFNPPTSLPAYHLWEGIRHVRDVGDVDAKITLLQQKEATYKTYRETVNTLIQEELTTLPSPIKRLIADYSFPTLLWSDKIRPETNNLPPLCR